MAKTTVEELAEFGQSIWLDTISRSMIDSGQLKKLIDSGVRGMTSNPTIFEKAISGSSDYDEKIEELYKAGKSTFEIYDELTVRDIQDAADIYKPLYERTNRLDGYVSLEVNPELAYKTEETIEEAKRLHAKVNRDNVMFKVPATDQGFGAIETLLGDGININITLIFSIDQYMKTAQAFLKGMKKFLNKQGDLSSVASVASVFVSRVDTRVDKMLHESMAQTAEDATKSKLRALQGKAAVAYAHLIYKKHLDIFSDKEWEALREKGANLQRVLWGSTGTKNPAYSDIKYVTELIAKNTVNTVPQNTLEAFLDHGEIKEALTAAAEESQKIVNDLGQFGIDLKGVCAKLLEDGTDAFTNSFVSLLSTLEKKAAETSV